MPTVSGAPLDLYYWPTPNGWKVSIMLEECGLPYRIVPVNIGKGEQFAPDFLALSPNNKVPALVDPDGPGGVPLTLFESGAILQYLGRRTGRFYPGDERARSAVDAWLFWQMASFGPMLGQLHHFRIFASERIPYALERFAAEAERLYGVLDRRLAGRDHLVEDYSIADIAVLPWAKLWQRQGLEIARYPHVGRWLDALLARPAVRRGLAARA